MKAILGFMLGVIITVSGYDLNHRYFHTVKHTGLVYVAGHANNLGYILQHPNGEAFVMKFDEDVVFNQGGRIRDIAYTDVSRTVRHLEGVTAQ
jgi:hypothetical protein